MWISKTNQRVYPTSIYYIVDQTKTNILKFVQKQKYFYSHCFSSALRMTLIRSPFQILISRRRSHFIRHPVNDSNRKATNIIYYLFVLELVEILQFIMILYNFEYLMIPFMWNTLQEKVLAIAKPLLKSYLFHSFLLQFFAHLLERRITRQNSCNSMQNLFQSSKIWCLNRVPKSQNKITFGKYIFFIKSFLV